MTDRPAPRLGGALFLSEPSEQNLARLAAFPERGLTAAFTSLHIPEDRNVGRQPELLRALGAAAAKAGVRLYADVSPLTLRRLALPGSSDAARLCALADWGVGGLRFDFGFGVETIALVSRTMPIQLNASAVTASETMAFLDAGGEAENVEVLHNYYPRVDTGLARRAYLAANRRHHAAVFRVGAFVPGDGMLRGPLHAGLPTLEEHRDLDPVVAAVDLWCGSSPGGPATNRGQSRKQPANAHNGGEPIRDVDTYRPPSRAQSVEPIQVADTYQLPNVPEGTDTDLVEATNSSTDPNDGADTIYIGDIDLRPETWLRWAHLQQGVVPIRWKRSVPERTPAAECAALLTGRVLTNRVDEAARVIRVHETRALTADGTSPMPRLDIGDVGSGAPRPRGSVTVDNAAYGRYSGEAQITREDRPADPRVTVLGRVLASDLRLLDLLVGGASFLLLER